MSYELLVQTHAAFGAAALLTFWMQMALRKGGRSHRWVGRLYAGVMLAVLGTAVPMTIVLAIEQHWAAGALLGFLIWITASAGAGALMAARWKDRRISVQWRIGRILSGGLLVISATLLALTMLGGPLFFGLGAFGAWAAISDLRTPADAPVWRSWKRRHIESVLGTGIAVHVAFFAFGLRNLIGDAFTDLHFLLSFVVPTVAGMVGGSLLVARFAPESDRAAGGQVEA